MSLLDAFLAHARARPDAPALIAPSGNVTTYGDLARLSAGRAEGFASAGVGAGDVVLVARGVSPDLYATLLGLFRLGAVAMFPEPAAGLKGLAVAIDAARPKAMIGGAKVRALRPFISALRQLPVLPEGEASTTPPVAISENAPALITFTSGSTGRPKGILRSDAFLMLQHKLLEDLRRTKPSDVDLITLPVFILSNLAAGAASVIAAGDLRKPAQLDGARLRAQIVAHRVNRVVAPPAVCARLAEGAPPMPQLEAIFTGGGPVFPNLLHALKRFAPNAKIHAVYGSTEAEPIAHIDYDNIAEADWSAMQSGQGLLAGKPIAEIQIALRDGEIEVAGAHVNRGYLNPADDASTKITRDGVLWHKTGDAARRDAQGRLWLLGRKEAAQGELYPFAIETAALSWPGVTQAALLASPEPARLAVAGVSLDVEDLKRRAIALGAVTLVVLSAIPMDKRHNSKIDYAALRRLLA
ncbi:MAG: AMP-binding protein [Alphaproteobacteria bacterium]